MWEDEVSRTSRVDIILNPTPFELDEPLETSEKVVTTNTVTLGSFDLKKFEELINNVHED